MKAAIRRILAANGIGVKRRIHRKRRSIRGQSPPSQQEIAAKADAWLLQKKIAEAQPVSGSKCRQKACPFPAVINGECRAPAADRYAEASTIPSQLALTIEAANKMGYWS